ncbi:MAG: hypothetical protein L0H93_10080 [Nocardioides sp.]|nr:hypothetical protein [Nocardioides sp.]
MTHLPPERVRVTGPPRRTPRRASRARDIDDQTLLGSVLMRSLLRAQLRLAMLVLLPVFMLAFGLPLAFHVAPSLADVRILGIPLAWVILGFAIYPILFLLGWAYVCRAERNERDFTELLDTAESP